MKNSIKLLEVKTLGGTGSIKSAVLEIVLENEATESKNTFIVESTGMSLRITSEMSLCEMRTFSKWLDAESEDESNLRNNSSEIRILAKRFLKIHTELNSSTSI